MPAAVRSTSTRVDGTGLTLSPSYPATIVANDLILLHAFYHNGTTTTTGTWGTPTGFTLIRKQDVLISAAKKGELAVFARRAVGNESGTVSVTRTGNSGTATVSTANMVCWQDVAGTTDTDGYEAVTGVSDEVPPYDMTVTTLGDERQVVAWVFANDNAQATGVSSGGWQNVIAPYTDTTGPDYAGHVARVLKSQAGDQAGQWSQATGIEGALVGLALLPILAQNLTRTVSDTITTVAESVSRIITFVRSGADTTSVSDSLSRAAISFQRTLSDTLSAISDSVTRVVTLPRTITDTVASATDEVQEWVTLIRVALDTTTHSESVSRAAIAFSRTASDTLGAISDSVTRAVQFVRSAAESIAIGADTVAAEVFSVIERTASDTVAIGVDTVARVLSVFRAGTDAVITSDSISKVSTFARNVSDTITTVTDSAARALESLRAAVDTTSVSDTVIRIIPIVRSLGDTVASATDSISRLANKLRVNADNTSVSDAIVRAWTGTRTMLDTLPAITDTVATSLSAILYRTVSDTITAVTDVVSRIGNFRRSAADALSVSDLAGRAITYARAVSDSVVGISDVVVRGGVTVRRTVQDSIDTVTDFITSFKGLPKFIGEFVRVGKSRNIWRVGRNNNDTIVPGENKHVIRGDD